MYLSTYQPITSFGLISDTHGLMRPEIPEIFKNVDYILHAGDIGKPSIIRDLDQIAPTIAVIGNIDVPKWYPELKKTEIVETPDKRILLIHDLDTIDFESGAAEFNAIIYGHTHKFSAHQKNGLWLINPGSAGIPRFLSQIGVAVMTICGNDIAIKHHPIHGELKKNTMVSVP